MRDCDVGVVARLELCAISSVYGFIVAVVVRLSLGVITIGFAFNVKRAEVAARDQRSFKSFPINEELGLMFTAFACGVVVSLHASTPAAMVAAAMRTRCGLAAEIKTSATWDNETRRSKNDIMTPDAGLRAGSSLHPSKTKSPAEPAHSACRACVERVWWEADALSGREGMAVASSEVTGLLRQWSAGDESARDRLIPLVYDRLRELAHRRLGGAPVENSLNTTELVHEAYIRLVDAPRIDLPDRAHFLALASEIMRNLLVDRARARLAEKRGGGVRPLDLDEFEWVSDENLETVAELDDALKRLERVESPPGPAAATSLLWRLDPRGERYGNRSVARHCQARAALRSSVACARAQG